MRSVAKFSDFVREKRLAKGLTLRKFCELHKFDPGNHSKIENGIRRPPDNEDAMRNLAKALDIEDGSNEWFEFMDLAAAAKGELPKDILDDSEVLNMLPLFFRTIRGKRPDDEKFRELCEFLKEDK